MTDVTLYHWEPNANSGKPMLALMEKGVAFNSHYIDMLNFDQHKPEYLKINPQGTIPAMTHHSGALGTLMLVESTAIMEYVNAAFDGPELMPGSPRDHWRIRWWMKFMDQWLAPSFSMFGWKYFVGPNALAAHGKEKIEEQINNIPLPERQIAWRKAVYGLFSDAEMAESGRRIGVGIQMLEAELGKREWLASDEYSLADVNGFNLAYAMPLSQPHLANDDVTPNIMRWLRAIYRRPATRACWKLGRTQMASRVEILEQDYIPPRAEADGIASGVR